MKIEHRTAGILLVFFLAATFLAFSSASFARGSGNWYAIGFIEKGQAQSLWFANEPEAVCNQSLWYSFVSPLKGIDPRLLWTLLTLVLIPIGFASWYFFAKKLLRNSWTALLAATLVFFTVDEWALLSMPLGRHVVFFVLMPLAFWLFFESVEKKSHKTAAGVGVLFALMLSFHTLMAFFFATSLAAYAAGSFLHARFSKDNTTKTKNTPRATALPWKTVCLHAILAAILGVFLALPVILPSLVKALSGIPHPTYGDWARWGFFVFGLWIPKLVLAFGSKAILLKLGILTALSLTALHLWKDKNETAYVFLASTLIASFAFLFTPLAGLVGRLITPGILVEQWFWHTAPFALLAVVSVQLVVEKCKAAKNEIGVKHQRILAAGIVALILLPSTIFFFGLALNPKLSAEDFMGQSLGFFADKPNAVVLTDVESGYLLGILTPAHVQAVTLGYLVCPSPKTLLRQAASNQMYHPPNPALFSQWNVTHVLVNRNFWSQKLDVHYGKEGWQYPKSYEAAIAVFDNAGFKKTVLDPDEVVFEVKK